jgi:hypothetical protein
MRSLANFVAWTCVGLVALPIAPCALISQNCDLASAAEPFSARALAQDAATGAGPQGSTHSCCDQRANAPGKNTSDKEPASPCPRGCCRLVPVGPTVEKTADAQSLSVTADLPGPVGFVIGREIAPAQEPLLPAQTLQSLSCLWRC